MRDNRIMGDPDACVTCGRVGRPHADCCEDVSAWLASFRPEPVIRYRGPGNYGMHVRWHVKGNKPCTCSTAIQKWRAA